MRRARLVLACLCSTALLLAIGCRQPYLPDVRSGALTISKAFAPEPIGRGSMAVYLTIANAGDVPDTLVAVETPLAAMGMIHATEAGRGMVAAPSLVIAAHGSVRLVPGGTHFMFEQLHQTISAGEVVPVTLVFARQGRVAIRAPVVTYAEVDALRGR